MQNQNNRKTKLLIYTLLAIIVLFFAGIVYQFVVIKSLQRKIDSNTNTSIEYVINNINLYKSY